MRIPDEFIEDTAALWLKAKYLKSKTHHYFYQFLEWRWGRENLQSLRTRI